MANAVTPDHYTANVCSPIELIDAYDLNFNLGNVIKYAARAGQKNGLEDLKKARWYLNHEIMKEEAPDSNVRKVLEGCFANPNGEFESKVMAMLKEFGVCLTRSSG